MFDAKELLNVLAVSSALRKARHGLQVTGTAVASTASDAFEFATHAANQTAAAGSSAFGKARDGLQGIEALHLGKFAEAVAAPASDALEGDTEVAIDEENKSRKGLNEAKKEYNDFGGWSGFANGNWLLLLIQKSFMNYFERANGEYFRKKYPDLDVDSIAEKIIAIAAKNAAILGAISGASSSTNLLVGIFTLGVALPANLTIVGGAICVEAIMLVRIQLELVAKLAKLYGVPLDTDDPEDIQTILAFGLGGSASVGTAGMKIGGRTAGNVAKKIFAKDTLKLVQKIAMKMGIKILQKNIVKNTVPVVSVGLGLSWNYLATRTVGRLSIKNFKQRLLAGHASEQDPVTHAERRIFDDQETTAEAAITTHQPEQCPIG